MCVDNVFIRGTFNHGDRNTVSVFRRQVRQKGTRLASLRMVKPETQDSHLFARRDLAPAEPFDERSALIDRSVVESVTRVPESALSYRRLAAALSVASTGTTRIVYGREPVRWPRWKETVSV